MFNQDMDLSVLRAGQCECADLNDFEDNPASRSIDIPILPQCPEPLHSLLCEMSQQRATDIHIDMLPSSQCEVRFRVDGIVHSVKQLEKEPGQRLINQIKVAAKIGIGRNFTPSESQFRWMEEWGPKDIRVVLTPAGNGESIHLRIMTVPDKIHNIAQLGLSEQHHALCKQTLGNPAGMILVSGSTGAGKSSTLYALASILSLKNRIGMSIEDPIEYNLPYLRQIQVDTERGLTMYEGLRTILRMDPDVILVGEIRDEPSAVTAARAAMAGKLVIATVHARDAAAAVDSLNYLSVPNFIIGSTLRLVISQSLVRRLCMGCSVKRQLTKPEKQLFQYFGVIPPECVYDPAGCEDCTTYGYIGRGGVFEMAAVDPAMGQIITSGAGQEALRASFRQAGYKPLIVDALEKAATGVTSLDEVRQACWLDILNMEHELKGKTPTKTKKKIATGGTRGRVKTPAAKTAGKSVTV